MSLASLIDAATAAHAHLTAAAQRDVALGSTSTLNSWVEKNPVKTAITVMGLIIITGAASRKFAHAFQIAGIVIIGVIVMELGPYAVPIGNSGAKLIASWF